jgi:ATP-dependent Zn protease
MRSEKQVWSTAVHEAGHAVVARVLGLQCGKVTIAANYRTRDAGYGVIADPWAAVARWDERGKYRPAEAALRARVIAYMAGREAEEELLGHCPGGDGDDQYQIALMLDTLGQTELEPRLRTFARAIVRRHRSKIEALARALMERRTMSDKQVRLAAGLPPRLRRLSQKEAYRRWLATAQRTQ